MDDALPLANDLIWGAEAIGGELYGERNARNTRKAFYLLENRRVPAEKIGSQWVASRRRLRQRLCGGEAA